MLTLKELKKIVKVADVEKRIPSVKSLKEHKVVVKEMINADTTISVYDHGYVLYTAGKDLLASREIENIFENSDFILMLNQAAGDRQILAKQLNISPYQLSYVTNSGEGEGLLFYGTTIIPFKDKFDKTLKLYGLMTTKPGETLKRDKEMRDANEGNR